MPKIENTKVAFLEDAVAGSKFWRDSKVTSLILTAQKKQKIQLTVNGELKQLRLKKGRNVVISS